MSQAKFTASERERGLVGAICSIYGLNYNTFLQTAKKLEKAELLRIVKANGRGKTAKFLERVA